MNQITANQLRANRYWALVLLSILTLLCYSNTFHASWHLDDYHNIIHNSRLQAIGKSGAGWWDALHAPENGRVSRPVARVSFAVNRFFGGYDVFGYHLVNIAIHLLTCGLLFLMTLKLFETPRLSGKYEGSRQFIALLAATLWAVHPIQTQAVTYIVQRMASLAALFYLLSLFCYVKARMSPQVRNRLLWALVSVVAFAASLGSKENAATLPVAAAMMEIIFFQDLDQPRIRRICIWSFLGLGGLVALLATIFFIGTNPMTLFQGSGSRFFTPLERLLTQPRVLVFYLSQIFYPIPSRLSIEHDVALSRSLFDPWTTLPAIFVVLALIGLGVAAIRRQPLAAFAILFFFLNHAVESTFLRLELIFEHRNYLPTLFVFVPIAAGLKWLLDHYQAESMIRQGLVALLTILIAGFALGTYTRNFDWATEKSLWEDAHRKAPRSSRPLNNLAYAYYEPIGEHGKALELYRQALTLGMTNVSQRAMLLNNIASIYFYHHDFKTAADYWTLATEAYSKYPAVKYRLALALARMGELDRAAGYLETLIADRPNYYDGWLLKGSIRLQQGRIAEALACFKRCLVLHSLDQNALMNAGMAFAALGRPERAEMFFRTARPANRQDRSLLVWLIGVNLTIGDQADVKRYIRELFAFSSLEQIERATETVDKVGLIDPGFKQRIIATLAAHLRLKTEEMARESSAAEDPMALVERP